MSRSQRQRSARKLRLGDEDAVVFATNDLAREQPALDELRRENVTQLRRRLTRTQRCAVEVARREVVDRAPVEHAVCAGVRDEAAQEGG